jgi:glutathione S-transferase
MKHADAKFTETRETLYVPGYKERLLRHTPSGKVPVLKHGHLTMWDSLAICEYVAEQFPSAGLWPADPAARALARAVSAEMHAGFTAIRGAMPFNCRARGRHVLITPEVQTEIDRVQALWQGCRETYGKSGAWLFGRFTIADAMYAPVVLRFITYGVTLEDAAQTYVETVQGDPPVKEWIASAERETEIMESNEVGR